MVHLSILILLVFVSILPRINGFECFTCNMNSDDSDKCVDEVETCEPGIESCTMVTYTTNGRTHIRKFCTSPGTPIYQYLLFFPGSALCQNIETSNDNQHFPETAQIGNDLEASPPGEAVGPPSHKPSSAKSRAKASHTVHRSKRVRREGASPPAPPQKFSSSLLCVCSTERCNHGQPHQVLERLMLSHLPKGPQKIGKKHTDEEGFQTLRA